MKKLLFCLFVLTCFPALADETPAAVEVEGIPSALAVEKSPGALAIEVYLDAYYAIDTDTTLSIGKGNTAKRVPKKDRPLNAVGYRNNELNINMAQITVSTAQDRYRGSASFQFGTIPISSWSGGYLNLQEAHLGFKPVSDLGGEGNQLWIDGGILLTHIGNELLLPKGNWLSTLALVAMYEPFYQAGVRATYNWGDTLSAEFHLMNGYGMIEDNNASKTVGWLIGYTPLDHLSVSWGATLGDEANAGDTAAVRFYNNLNLNYQILKQLGIRGQFDFATQTASPFYYGAQLSARYDFLFDEAGEFPILGATLRGEVIQDPGGMLTPDRLQGFGATLGLEYKPTVHSFVRLEGRQLMLDPTHNQIFMDAKGTPSSTRTEMMINTGVWF